MILYKSHKSLCSTYTYLHHASTEIQREERDIWVLCVCVRRESRMGFLLLLEQKGNVYKKMQPHTKSLMGFLLGEKGRKEKKWNIIKTTGLYWIHPVSLSLSPSPPCKQTTTRKEEEEEEGAPFLSLLEGHRIPSNLFLFHTRPCPPSFSLLVFVAHVRAGGGERAAK